MESIVENAEKRRKLFHGPTDGWNTLQSILENFVLGEKISSSDHALDHLTRWFQIISADVNKMNTFRQWVMPSPDVKRELYESDSSGPSLSPVSSSSSSPDNRTIDAVDIEDKRASPKRGGGGGGERETLLRQLLQHQQQQFAIIQQLQQAPSKTSLATVLLDTKSSSPGSIVTVILKGGRWHPHSAACGCTCGFTSDGSTITSSRIAGGTEGELRFTVPLINTSNRIVVHLSLCSAPDSPIVCLEPFSIIAGTHSDEDSEGSTEIAVDEDEDEDDGGLSPTHSPNASLTLSPKHLMTIRERMLEVVKKGPQQGATISIIQQPSVKVVWKNRRVDVPYKLRVGLSDELSSSKLVALAVVTDHKGRLQTDAAENIVEDFNAAGIATFNNLRMSKGTWGKEWNINFAVVVKSSVLSNPVVLSCSSACAVIVKTRKNPQIRHSGGIGRSESPPSPVFVERKPDQGVKRNRVEDLLDTPSSPATRIRASPANIATSPSGKHSEDMFSLLCAAEIKQQEQVHVPLPPIQTALQNLSIPDSKHAGFNNVNNNNNNIQTLLNHIEDVKSKFQPRLSVIEQPPLKKDQKVLTVKKGKPFRSPFRVQLSSSLQALGQTLSQDQFSCVVVLRNDKGEEVAVKNNEVLFDWNGFASFPGLMVMKGTWGKTVNLTFEARWANRRAANLPDAGNSWPSSKLFVIAETTPIQLMCYTKDKKN